MARKRHPSLTYAQCTALFSKRLKSRDHKRVFIDCKLYDRGTHFEITHDKFVRWDNNNSKGEWQKVTEEVSLATITPADVLTMTFADQVDITACNRLTSLTGWPVGLNKRSYSNYRTHVRVYCRDDGWRDSEPYFAGMQWDVTNGGAKLLNPQPDLKIVVDNDKMQQAKREFDAIRKLCKVSAKIGAFDEFAGKYMLDRWAIPLKDVKQLHEINIANPEFDDAMALIHHGGYNTTRPDMHYWNHNIRQYIKRDLHEARADWLRKCVENGLKQLRREYYEANDGYVEVAA